jgi:hypothetical protein
LLEVSIPLINKFAALKEQEILIPHTKKPIARPLSERIQFIAHMHNLFLCDIF